MPSDIPFFFVGTLLAVLLAVYSVIVARRGHSVLARLSRHIKYPYRGADDAEEGQAKAQTCFVVPGVPWRVGVDARPMIGAPTSGATDWPVFGVGQYLRYLMREVLRQDRETEYVFWSSSLKHGVSDWYEDFVRSSPNARAVHARCPNRVVDAAAWFDGLRALEELIGRVHVSYDANYFQVRPGPAFSICTVPDLSFRDRRFRRRLAFQEKAAWRAGRADVITTVSQASKRVILQELRSVRPEKVRVVYGAADPEHFNPAVARDRFAGVAARYALHEPYFLYVGETAVRKNLDTLIRGFQALRTKTPNVWLILVGCRARELDGYISPDMDFTNVRPIGFVPSDDLPGLYHGARALVSASHEEGFGLPTVEAMLTGQLVAVSNIPASNEVAGTAGLFFDPTRVDELTSVLSRVLTMSAAERQSRIDNGIRLASRFSWAQSAKEMLALFEIGFRTQRHTTAASGDHEAGT